MIKHFFRRSNTKNIRSPFLIDLKGKDFEEYVRSLSKVTRKDFRQIEEKNRDIDFDQIDFDPKLVGWFMELWEKQIIFGEKIKWPFCIEYLKYLSGRNKLLCFCAKTKDKGEIISIIFIEKHGTYTEAHPPVYDKEKYLDRSLAKFMNFNLIKYLLNDSGINWLDLDGGCNGSWQDLVILHREGKHNSHKWIYVPKEIKKDPHLAKPYVVQTKLFSYKKYLIEKNCVGYQPFRSLKTKMIRFLYWHRGQRMKKLRELIFRV